MWIIFEGLDKAGKTTLEWELLKATNFKQLVIDRGPVGYMIFDKMFSRETKLGNQEFIHQARKIMKNHDFLVVYCYAPTNTVMNRLKEHNESCPYHYDTAQKLLRDSINRYYRKEKVLKINTSDLTIDECVKLIIEKIEEAQKREL